MKVQVALSVFVIILFLGGFFLYVFEIVVPDTKTEEQFVVKKGMTNGDVLTELKKSDLIRNGFIFSLIQVFRGNDTISAGAYTLSADMNIFEVSRALYKPDHFWVSLSAGLNSVELSKRLSLAMGWTEEDEEQFVRTHRAMRWNKFNEDVRDVLSARNDWSQLDRELFTSIYVPTEKDILNGMYVPENQLISADMSFAQISNFLMTQFVAEASASTLELVEARLDIEVVDEIVASVRSEALLLPDLIPLAASDIDLKREYGRTKIIFTTTYWNGGDGALELVMGQEEEFTGNDYDADIMQRIYRKDGQYEDQLSGNFYWHQTHLHYHYSDFITYELLTSDGEQIAKSVDKRKATFCVRDVELVDGELRGTPKSPKYSICSRVLQGVSVGWGDSYYFTYPDQNLDVTGLLPGEYVLIFEVNPKGIIEEKNTENNFSMVRIYLNVTKGEVEILEEREGVNINI